MITDKNQEATTQSQPESSATVWFRQHFLASQSALKQLLSSPLSSLLTICIIAIALSLPTGLQLLIKNLESGQENIDEQAQITLYLTTADNADEITSLVKQLKQNPNFVDVKYRSSQEALEEFGLSSTLKSTFANLNENPLPASITILPDTSSLNSNDLGLIVDDLKNLETVEDVKIDILWLSRLFTMIDLAKQFAAGLSLFLVFAVLMLIGNTVKMLGQNYQDEIAISKLVGATDAYVRRPFIYSGFYYGFAGSILCLLFILLGLVWISPKIAELSSLYDNQFTIIGLNFGDIFSVICTGIVLGIGGAWVAANYLINKLSL